jgi:SAM-dependent methyltransferase
MTSDADRIIGLYERHAFDWDRDRGRDLFEKPWLDRFLALVPAGGPILDIGCGSAQPIAGYLIGKGCHVTGVDASPRLIGLCRSRFPQQTWLAADMRHLSLSRCYAGLLAWDSFFHLCPDDQRRVFSIFGRHAGPGAALMFTSGPSEGVAIGSYRGEPLYHASLSEAEYRSLLPQHGFEVVAHVAEDPECGGHTVWLARLSMAASPSKVLQGRLRPGLPDGCC